MGSFFVLKTKLINTEDWTRTSTDVTIQQILSLSCLPFHHFGLSIKEKSGRRDSNPRPSPWQGDALPTELLPPIEVAKLKFIFEISK